MPCFIGLVSVTACLVVGASLATPLPSITWTWWGAMLRSLPFCLARQAVSSCRTPRAPREGGRYVVSVATIPHIASILLLPPSPSALLGGRGMLIDELRGRSSEGHECIVRPYAISSPKANVGESRRQQVFQLTPTSRTRWHGPHFAFAPVMDTTVGWDAGEWKTDRPGVGLIRAAQLIERSCARPA